MNIILIAPIGLRPRDEHEERLEHVLLAVVDLALGELGLDVLELVADADAARLGAAADRDGVDAVGRALAELDRALQRGAQLRERQRVRAGGVAVALVQLADEPGVAQRLERLAELDLTDALERDLLRSRRPVAAAGPSASAVSTVATTIVRLMCRPYPRSRARGQSRHIPCSRPSGSPWRSRRGSAATASKNVAHAAHARVVAVGVEQRPAADHVVGDDQRAGTGEPERLVEVGGVALLVGVDEDQVERPAQARQRFERGRDDDLRRPAAGCGARSPRRAGRTRS